MCATGECSDCVGLRDLDDGPDALGMAVIRSWTRDTGGVPVATDEEETTPVEHETGEQLMRRYRQHNPLGTR